MSKIFDMNELSVYIEIKRIYMCGFNVLFVYVLLGILILSMFMKCNVFLGDGM